MKCKSNNNRRNFTGEQIHNIYINTFYDQKTAVTEILLRMLALAPLKNKCNLIEQKLIIPSINSRHIYVCKIMFLNSSRISDKMHIFLNKRGIVFMIDKNKLYLCTDML